MAETYTPDPIPLIVNRLNAVEARLEAVEAAQKAADDEHAAPVSEKEAFLAVWHPPTEEQKKAFFALYPDAADGKGKRIEAMTEANVAEATTRALFGYTWQGANMTLAFPDYAKAIWEAIGRIADVLDDQASADALFELGGGTLWPDFAAYALLTGIFKPQPLYAQGLGAGARPEWYGGQTIQGYLENALSGHGSPSGG
jgi:hypothetical protein